MRILPALVLLPFLGACASLTEEQCISGNWSSIGYNDGINGRSADYVSQHFEACADLGITPDIGAWQVGRDQGLLRYCTPQNAYITGRNGGRFNQVCPAAQSASLNHAYEWGADYYVTNQEILALTEEKHQIELIIASTLSHPDLSPEEAAQLASLNSRMRIIDLKLWRLENRLERYAEPPY